MSLGIAFKGPEGIVLAADSRVTLTAHIQQLGNLDPMLISSTYDNATKLLRVKGQDYVGAVTYGAGAIGLSEPRTAHSYMPEFEQKLKGSDRLSVHDFANALSEFFLEKWNAQNIPYEPGQDMIFIVGGYDKDAPYGRLFDIYIPSRPTPVEWHGQPGQYGLVWGGQHEYVDRLIQGFDNNLPAIVKGFLNLDDTISDELQQHLRRSLQAPVPYAFLPLQDCVDLTIFLIRATMLMQHWLLGVRGVGGNIDVTVITQENGCEDIQKKELKGEGTWPAHNQ